MKIKKSFEKCGIDRHFIQVLEKEEAEESWTKFLRLFEKWNKTL